MTLRSTVEHANPLAHQDGAHLSAKLGAMAHSALDGAANPARQALDGMAHDARQLGEQVAPALRHAADQASDMAQDGLDALRSEGRHLLSRARSSSDFAADYVRHEPLKAVLVAMAGGALLMAVISLFGRSRSHR